MTGLAPLTVATEVAATFERHGVRYALGGSMASAVFGEPARHGPAGPRQCGHGERRTAA